MNTKQLFGLIGSIALLIGVFCPIISIPMIGNINYFQTGEYGNIPAHIIGGIILISAIISFVLVLMKKYKGLWFTSIISIVLIALTYIKCTCIINEMNENRMNSLKHDSFGWLADLAVGSVQIQWGLAVLIFGALLLIVSAIIKNDNTKIRDTASDITNQ